MGSYRELNFITVGLKCCRLRLGYFRVSRAAWNIPISSLRRVESETRW